MLRPFKSCFHVQKRLQSTFLSGDSCVVQWTSKPSTHSWFIEALEPDQILGIDKGNISHNDILNQTPRSVVSLTPSKNPYSVKYANNKYIVTKPTLEEYIRLTKRAVQPIYHLDTVIITALADINIDYPEITHNDNDDTYRLKSPVANYLEAGTGHGSLTLTIAKLLHPANAYAKLFNNIDLRGAVLHSIDNNISNQNLAKKHLKNFHRGKYFNNVEFHNGEPSQWLIDYNKEEKPFLDGVFLDMPDPEYHLKTISENMKIDSDLIIFQPSITQFFNIIDTIKNDKCQLFMKNVYELQPGIGGGLREWDLKSLFIDNYHNNKSSIDENGTINKKKAMVCRPKVGNKVMAGGFIGVFKKMDK